MAQTASCQAGELCQHEALPNGCLGGESEAFCWN